MITTKQIRVAAAGDAVAICAYLTINACITTGAATAHLIRIAAADQAIGADTGFTILLIAAVFSGGTVRHTIRPRSAGARRADKVGSHGIGAKQAGAKDNKYNGCLIDHLLLRVHWSHPFLLPSRLSKSSILASAVV
jgi:hypothetical protein